MEFTIIWGNPDGQEHLAPLPADYNGAIWQVKCETKIQGRFVAALIAFADEELIVKAYEYAVSDRS